MKDKVDQFIPTTYCKRIDLCLTESSINKEVNIKLNLRKTKSISMIFSVKLMVINVNAVKIG